jgi:hypothetical protein
VGGKFRNDNRSGTFSVVQAGEDGARRRDGDVDEHDVSQSRARSHLLRISG